ncbi:hypothetical protein AB832_02885 [Flavobacteriaceae bacterium (ex Bugula neritina AB1)]|nr:hypothetical protein AB832_02885 [Flavobacteriaceae bacterium (ex Bugula neritina AB1)]
MDKKILFLCFFIGMTTFSSAQRIKVDKKKLAFLKNETKVGVQLVLSDNFEVHGGFTEEAYLVDKKRNLAKKGGEKRVERWELQYNEAKKKTWKKDFLNEINNRLTKYSNLSFTSDNEGVNYILRIEMDWVYFGYDTFRSGPHEEAKLQVTLKFIQTGNPEIEVYSTQTPHIIGESARGEFTDILRVGKCYSKLGFLLELQLKRILK